MNKVSELFEVSYGGSLELNSLVKTHYGINFVSRTAKNNGISAKVQQIDDLSPNPARSISVAGGGSVMESFLQPEPYYTGYHVFCLIPKIEMTDAQKLFYCTCLRANKYRYNYGRQANRTLKDILIPSLNEIPIVLTLIATMELTCLLNGKLTLYLILINGIHLNIKSSLILKEAEGLEKKI
jgi:hypothetical protein